MNNENRDLLIDVDIDIPSGVDAALGWLPPEEPKAKDTKPARERKPEPADDVIETIRKEHAEALRRKEDEWKTQVESRDARLTEAEKKAKDNEYYAARAHYDKVASDTSNIETALNAQKQWIEFQKREELAAEDAGDKRAAQNAREAIAVAAAHMAQLEAGKSGVEQELLRAKRLVESVVANQDAPKREEPKKEEPKQLTPDDYITSIRQGVGTKVADWLNENREFITDSKLNTKFLKFADYFTTVEEKPLNSREFLEALNAKFGLSEEAQEEEASEEDTEVETEPEPKKKPVVAAPVSRNSAPKNGSNGVSSGGKVRLNPDEQSMATQMYPNLSAQEAREKYARNKAMAIRDGKYR